MADAYWNGEKCTARKVKVIVGTSMRPTWWCADMKGHTRRAVEVRYHDQTFLLDNEDGQGWAKVTLGFGTPNWGHSSLPSDSVVLEASDGRSI